MEQEILKGKTLLVVDDEVDLRDIISSEMEFMGAKVFQADNITSAQKILEANKIDLVVSDIRMPGGTGIDLLDNIKTKDVNFPPIMLITGFADITVEDAFNKGAEALINKPFKLDDLLKMVVRYTSPYKERFSGSETTLKSIPSSAIDSSKVAFGRGGLSMELSNDGRRYNLGDTIQFTFDIGNDRYEGIGICRWIKSVDTSNRVKIGLEFTQLDEQTLINFQKQNQGKAILPFIPSAH